MYDGHGSTRFLTDSSGNITDRMSYDAYGIMLGGNPTNLEPPTNNLLYSGEQFDVDLQQQYLRARYYDQAIGAFNRLDPFEGNIFDPQSLHKYAYAHSDPVNGIDPSGERNFSLMGVLSVASIASSLTTFVLGPTVGGAVLLGVDIVTFPLGFLKVLSKLGQLKNLKGIKAILTTFQGLEESAIAANAWLKTQKGVRAFLTDQALVDLGISLQSAKRVDIVAENIRTGGLILAEAKTKLSFSNLLDKDIGKKVLGTTTDLKKYYESAGVVFPGVDKIIVTYKSLGNMGGMTIDPITKIVSNKGVPIEYILDGKRIQVIAEKVTNFL